MRLDSPPIPPLKPRHRDCRPELCVDAHGKILFLLRKKEDFSSCTCPAEFVPTLQRQSANSRPERLLRSNKQTRFRDLFAKQTNKRTMAHKTNNPAIANEVSATQTNATANEVSNPAIAKAEPKTQRVLETRQDWECIFTHTVALIATLAKGEALEDDCREGFHFVKAALSPNCRPYAQSLLAGFASKKAGKFLAETPLAEQEKRQEIALAILLKTRLGGKDEASCKRILGKAEPKQARTLATAVLATL